MREAILESMPYEEDAGPKDPEVTIVPEMITDTDRK